MSNVDPSKEKSDSKSKWNEFTERFREETAFQSFTLLFIIFPIFVIFVFADLGFAAGSTVLINGIINGSSLALLALGFSIIFGVAKMFKLSLGGYFVLGAYSAFWFNAASNLNVDTIIDNPTNNATSFGIKLIITIPLILFIASQVYVFVKLGKTWGTYFIGLNLVSWFIHRELSLVSIYNIFSLKATYQAILIQSAVGMLAVTLIYFELSKKQIILVITSFDLFLLIINLVKSTVFQRSPGIYFAVMIYAIVFVALVSMSIDRYLLDEIRDSPTNILIVTFGIALFFQSFIAELSFPLNSNEFKQFGIDDYAFNGVVPKGERMIIFDTPVQSIRLVAMLGSIVLIAGVLIFINYTPMGLAMKAVSQDKDAAWLVGINVRKVYLVATGLGMGLAATAGILISPYDARPSWGLLMGWFPLVIAIAVVTLGGLGSIAGSVVAGFVVGFAQSYVSQVDPQKAILVPFVVIFITMLIRPEGLFGIPEEDE